MVKNVRPGQRVEPGEIRWYLGPLWTCPNPRCRAIWEAEEGDTVQTWIPLSGGLEAVMVCPVCSTQTTLRYGAEPPLPDPAPVEEMGGSPGLQRRLLGAVEPPGFETS